ncbi:MAG: ABC transporter permease [Proteobacteria bacterium]|nr:ABC transporter permease [Pseudomonadota bacterium]
MSVIDKPSSGTAMDKASPGKPPGTRFRLSFPYFLIVPVIAIVIWETASRLELLPAMLFPSVGTIVTTALDTLTGWWGTADWYSGVWYVHALASAKRVIIGYFLGGVSGIVIGTIAGMFGLFHKMLDPSLQLLRPIPIVAWIPLAIAWFGIEDQPAIFLIALGTFFPTYINARHGIRYVDPVLIRAARMLGYATSWELFTRVVFWSALPNIFTGLRIGLGIAWMCVVTAEMLAVKSGFGYMLWDSFNFLRADLIITGMISIAVVGYATDRLMLLLQHAVMKWER